MLFRSLGERGRPWWDPVTDESLAARSASAAVALLRSRDTASSICPSDVARVVGGERWRDRLAAVRTHLWAMVDDGVLRATQGDDDLTTRSGVKGPIRLRRGPRF